MCADLVSAGRPADIDAFIAERIAVTGEGPFENRVVGSMSADEAASWQIIAERMSHLRKTAGLPERTAPYALWAGRMRRFSFDPWRRVGDAA